MKTSIITLTGVLLAQMSTAHATTVVLSAVPTARQVLGSNGSVLTSGSVWVGTFSTSFTFDSSFFDMSGNVWEITADRYRPNTYAKRAESPLAEARHNPKGPADSEDPGEPGVPKKVTRGGSFMCSDSYCRGYRPNARMKIAPDTGLQNTGFRCAQDRIPAQLEIK